MQASETHSSPTHAGNTFDKVANGSDDMRVLWIMFGTASFKWGLARYRENI